MTSNPACAAGPSIASMPTVAHAKPVAPRGAVSRRTIVDCHARAWGRELGEHLAPQCQAASRSAAATVSGPADADVPVEQQHAAPAAGAWDVGEHRGAATRARRGPAPVTRRPQGDVDADGEHAAMRATRATWRPGSAADVEHRPLDAQRVRARRIGRPVRASGRRRAAAGFRADPLASSGSSGSVERAGVRPQAPRSRGHRRELRREPGSRCEPCHRARIVDPVDVPQRRQVADRQPVGAQPGDLLGERVRRLIGTPRICSGPGCAQPDRPVATVEGRAEHGVRARRGARARRFASSARDPRGVSIPTSSAGPPTSANAAARRASRPAPLRDRANPAGIHGPVRRERQHVLDARPRDGSSVSARAAARDARGAGESQRRREPGLQCPGRGRLGDHDQLAGRPQRARTCRGPLGAPSPRTVPVTFERPARAAGRGRAPRRSASRPRPPAAPSRAASRSRGRGGRAPSSASRRAARIGPRSRERHARSGGGARTRAAGWRARACQRPRARRRAMRAPRHRSSAPPSTGPGDRRQLARVERAVAVHEADDVAWLAAAAPRSTPRRSRAAARATTRAPSRRATSAEPSRRAVVDDERREAGRHRGEHAGDRLRLVEHGEDHLDHARRLRQPKTLTTKRNNRSNGLARRGRSPIAWRP